jgi:hypothetical protein
MTRNRLQNSLEAVCFVLAQCLLNAGTALPAGAAAATPTTATTARRLWPCLVDGQGATLQVCAVHGCDGLLGGAAVRHLDESEAP